VKVHQYIVKMQQRHLTRSLAACEGYKSVPLLPYSGLITAPNNIGLSSVRRATVRNVAVCGVLPQRTVSGEVAQIWVFDNSI
jgi:hypothetical protein